MTKGQKGDSNMEEIENKTSIDEQYEETLRRLMTDLEDVDPEKMDEKTYIMLLKEVNAGYGQYRAFHDGNRQYYSELNKDATRLHEAELDRELEREKMEHEKECGKKERKSRFWSGVLTFAGGVIGTVGAFFVARMGWKTTLQMQANAIQEDHDELLPKSQGHKYVPKPDAFRVRL